MLFNPSTDSRDSHTRLIGRIAISVVNFPAGLASSAFDLGLGVTNQVASGVLHLSGSILERTFNAFLAH